MMITIFLLAFKGLAAWSSSDSCAPVSCENNLQGFEPHTRYEFTLHSNVRTSGTNINNGMVSEYTTELSIRTGASGCELVLEVASTTQLDDISDAPLRFSLQDGLVDEICPSEEETTESLNFKRSILSFIQAQVPGSDYLERDIFGNCVTNYDEQYNSAKFLKRKDLTKCSRHNEGSLAWIANGLPSVTAIIESTLLCNGDYSLNSVACHEQHTAKQPFSNDEMMTTTVSTKMEKISFAEDDSAFPIYEVNKFASIEMDMSVGQAKSDVNNANLLTTICEAKFNPQQIAVIPASVRSLMEGVRSSTHEEIVELWELAPSKCESAQQLIEDLLPWCRTDDCMAASAQLVRKMGNEHVTNWMKHAATTAMPTPALIRIMLQESKEQQSNVNMQFLATAINRACNNGECDSNEVIEAANYLDTRARDSCHDQADDTDIVLSALTSAKMISPDTVVACLDQPSQNILKLFQAASGRSCQDISPISQEVLLNGEKYSIEVRAAAYVQMWHCPTSELADSLPAIYDSIKSLQLQHFIYSHLQAMKFSTDPLKHFMKPILNKISLNEPHDYQNNQAYSKYWDTVIPMGHHSIGVDGYVIYERESPLPRAVHSNITLSFYGEPLNLLDLTVRQENLQKLMKEFMNPDAEGDDFNDVVAGVGNGMYESQYDRSELNIEGRLLGDILVSEHFDEERIRNDILNWGSTWDRMVEKMQAFDFADAFNTFVDSIMGKVQYNIKKDSILGVYEHAIPTSIGVPLWFSLDAFASTNFDISGGVTDYGIEGTLSPNAAISVHASMLIDMVGQQGVTVELNAESSTHNNLRFFFDYDNFDFEVRIDTPQHQQILSVRQEVTLSSPGGDDQIMPYDVHEEDMEVFGHRLYSKKVTSKDCQFFDVCARSLDVGVDKLDPSMTHILASLKKNDKLWLFQLGMPKENDPFMIKAWFAEEDKIYTIGSIIQLQNHPNYNLDIEYNEYNNEFKAQVEIASGENQGKYQLHGRVEINSDSTIDTLVVIVVPDHTVTVGCSIVNRPDRYSMAVDIDGVGNARIHSDVTFQGVKPQVASNLQFITTDSNGVESEFGYKVEGAYSNEVSSSTNSHKVYYVAQIRALDSFEVSGNVALNLKKNGWQLMVTSAIPTLQEPFTADMAWKYDDHGDVMKAQFALTKVNFPGYLNLRGGLLQIQGDQVKQTFTYKNAITYEIFVRGTKHSGSVDSKLLMKSSSNSNRHLNYYFTSTQFPVYNHELLIEFIPSVNGRNIKTRVETNAFLKWGVDFDDVSKQVSFHQLYKRQDKKSTKDYWLGFNGTVIGEVGKFYSHMNYVKGKTMNLDVRLKHGNHAEIEARQAATFIVDSKFSLNKGKKSLVSKSTLDVPAYIYTIPAMNTRQRRDLSSRIHAESNLEIQQRGANSFDYSVDVDVEEPAFKAGVTGTYSNRRTLKQASVALVHNNATFASTHLSLRTISNKDKDVHNLAVQIKYPRYTGVDTQFEIIDSTIRGNLKQGKIEKNNGIHLAFQTNHPEVVKLHANKIQFDSHLNMVDSAFNFDITAKCLTNNKKIHLGLEYEGDNSVAIDIRQTLDTTYPGAITGSGVYHADQQLVVFNFNRDKSPVTARLRWNTSNNAFVRLDMIQNDSKLSAHNIPIESSLLAAYESVGDFEHHMNLKYNLTWTGRRTTSAAIGAKLNNEDFQITMISEDYAIDGFPQKMKSNLMMSYGDVNDIIFKFNFDLPANQLSMQLVGGVQTLSDAITITMNIENNIFVGPASILHTTTFSSTRQRLWDTQIKVLDTTGRSSTGDLIIDFNDDESFNFRFSNEFMDIVRLIQIRYGSVSRSRRDTDATTSTLTVEAQGDDSSMFNHLFASGNFDETQNSNLARVVLNMNLDVDIPALDTKGDYKIESTYNENNSSLILGFKASNAINNNQVDVGAEVNKNAPVVSANIAYTNEHDLADKWNLDINFENPQTGMAQITASKDNVDVKLGFTYDISNPDMGTIDATVPWFFFLNEIQLDQSPIARHHHLSFEYDLQGPATTVNAELSIESAEDNFYELLGRGGFTCKATKCMLTSEIAAYQTNMKIGYDYQESDTMSEVTLYHSLTSDIEELQVANFGEYESKFGYMSGQEDYDHKVYAGLVDVLKHHSFDFSTTVVNNNNTFSFVAAGNNDLPTSAGIPVIGPAAQFVIEVNKDNYRFATFLDGNWVFKLVHTDCKTQSAFLESHFGDESNGFTGFEKFSVMFDVAMVDEKQLTMESVYNPETTEPFAHLYYDVAECIQLTTEFEPCMVGFQVNIEDMYDDNMDIRHNGQLTVSSQNLDFYQPKSKAWKLEDTVMHPYMHFEYSSQNTDPIELTMEIFMCLENAFFFASKLTFVEKLELIGIDSSTMFAIESLVETQGSGGHYYFNVDLADVGAAKTEFRYEELEHGHRTSGTLMFNFPIPDFTPFLASHYFEITNDEVMTLLLQNTIFNQNSDNGMFDDVQLIQESDIEIAADSVKFLQRFECKESDINMITKLSGYRRMMAFDFYSKVHGINFAVSNDWQQSLFEEMQFKWAPTWQTGMSPVLLVILEDFKIEFQPKISTDDANHIQMDGDLTLSNQWTGAETTYSVLQNALYALPQMEIDEAGARTAVFHQYVYQYSHDYNEDQKSINIEISCSAKADHNGYAMFENTVVAINLMGSPMKSYVDFEFLGKPTNSESYKANVGYEYTEPSSLVMNLGINVLEIQLDSKLGMTIEYEESPSVLIFWNMTQDVSQNEAMPALVSITNKVELVNAELSTNWWRVLNNFNIVNKFNFDVEYTGEHANNSIHTYFEPTLVCAITKEEFLYQLTVDHNSELFSQTGIPMGNSGFKVITTINRDMIQYHDILIKDDLSAENSFKRVTMVLISPLVMPFMPIIRKDLVDPTRPRRSVRQAEYNTNLQVKQILPDAENSFTVNQNYEIRKSQYVYKLEYETDWEELEALTASNFDLKTRLDVKRKELRVDYKINEEKYLASAKFDIDVDSYDGRDDGRVGVQVNELKLQQKIPFLNDLGIPNNIELTANCFVQTTENGTHASCDQTKLIFEAKNEILEYVFTGELKQHHEDLSGDFKFGYLDDQRLIQMNVPQQIHILITGVNDPASTCKYADSLCLLSVNAQVEIETSMDKFEEMQNVGAANIVVDLGHTTDKLTTNFDFSIQNAHAFGTKFNEIKVSVMHDEHPIDALTRLSLTIPEPVESVEYVLQMQFGQTEENARGKLDLFKSETDTMVQINYDLTLLNSAVSVSTNDLFTMNGEMVKFASAINWNIGLPTLSGGYVYSFDPVMMEAISKVNRHTHNAISEFTWNQQNGNTEALSFNFDPTQASFGYNVQRESYNHHIGTVVIWSAVPMYIGLDFNCNENANAMKIVGRLAPTNLALTYQTSSPDNGTMAESLAVEYMLTFDEKISFNLDFNQNLTPLDDKILNLFHVGTTLAHNKLAVDVKLQDTAESDLQTYQLALSSTITGDKAGLVLEVVNNDDTCLSSGLYININEGLFGFDLMCTMLDITTETTIGLIPYPEIKMSLNGKTNTASIKPVLELDPTNAVIGFVASQDFTSTFNTVSSQIDFDRSLLAATLKFKYAIDGDEHYAMVTTGVIGEETFNYRFGFVEDISQDGTSVQLNSGMDFSPAKVNIYTTYDINANKNGRVSVELTLPFVDGSKKLEIMTHFEDSDIGKLSYGVSAEMEGDGFDINAHAGDESIHFAGTIAANDGEIFNIHHSSPYLATILQGVTKISMNSEGRVHVAFEQEDEWVEFEIKLRRESIGFDFSASPTLANESTDDHMYEHVSGVLAVSMDGPAMAVASDIDGKKMNLQLDLSNNHLIKLIYIDGDDSQTLLLDFYNKDDGSQKAIGLVGSINNEPLSVILGSTVKDQSVSVTFAQNVPGLTTIPKKVVTKVAWNLPSSLRLDLTMDTWHKFVDMSLEQDTGFTLSFRNNIKKVPSFMIRLKTMDEQTFHLDMQLDKNKLELSGTVNDGKFEIQYANTNLNLEYGITNPFFKVEVNGQGIEARINALLKGDNNECDLVFRHTIPDLPISQENHIWSSTTFKDGNMLVTSHRETEAEMMISTLSYSFDEHSQACKISMNHNDTVLDELRVPQYVRLSAVDTDADGNFNIVLNINQDTFGGSLQYSVNPISISFSEDNGALVANLLVDNDHGYAEINSTIEGLAQLFKVAYSCADHDKSLSLQVDDRVTSFSCSDGGVQKVIEFSNHDQLLTFAPTFTIVKVSNDWTNGQLVHFVVSYGSGSYKLNVNLSEANSVGLSAIHPAVEHSRRILSATSNFKTESTERNDILKVSLRSLDGMSIGSSIEYSQVTNGEEITSATIELLHFAKGFNLIEYSFGYKINKETSQMTVYGKPNSIGWLMQAGSKKRFFTFKYEPGFTDRNDKVHRSLGLEQNVFDSTDDIVFELIEGKHDYRIDTPLGYFYLNETVSGKEWDITWAIENNPFLLTKRSDSEFSEGRFHFTLASDGYSLSLDATLLETSFLVNSGLSSGQADSGEYISKFFFNDYKCEHTLDYTISPKSCEIRSKMEQNMVSILPQNTEAAVGYAFEDQAEGLIPYDIKSFIIYKIDGQTFTVWETSWVSKLETGDYTISLPLAEEFKMHVSWNVTERVYAVETTCTDMITKVQYRITPGNKHIVQALYNDRPIKSAPMKIDVSKKCSNKNLKCALMLTTTNLYPLTVALDYNFNKGHQMIDANVKIDENTIKLASSDDKHAFNIHTDNLVIDSELVVQNATDYPKQRYMKISTTGLFNSSMNAVLVQTSENNVSLFDMATSVEGMPDVSTHIEGEREFPTIINIHVGDDHTVTYSMDPVHMHSLNLRVLDQVLDAKLCLYNSTEYPLERFLEMSTDGDFTTSLNAVVLQTSDDSCVVDMVIKKDDVQVFKAQLNSDQQTHILTVDSNDVVIDAELMLYNSTVYPINRYVTFKTTGNVESELNAVLLQTDEQTGVFDMQVKGGSTDITTHQEVDRNQIRGHSTDSGIANRWYDYQVKTSKGELIYSSGVIGEVEQDMGAHWIVTNMGFSTTGDYTMDFDMDESKVTFNLLECKADWCNKVNKFIPIQIELTEQIWHPDFASDKKMVSLHLGNEAQLDLTECSFKSMINLEVDFEWMAYIPKTLNFDKCSDKFTFMYMSQDGNHGRHVINVFAESVEHFTIGLESALLTPVQSIAIRQTAGEFRVSVMGSELMDSEQKLSTKLDIFDRWFSITIDANNNSMNGNLIYSTETINWDSIVSWVTGHVQIPDGHLSVFVKVPPSKNQFSIGFDNTLSDIPSIKLIGSSNSDQSSGELALWINAEKMFTKWSVQDRTDTQTIQVTFGHPFVLQGNGVMNGLAWVLPSNVRVGWTLKNKLQNETRSKRQTINHLILASLDVTTDWNDPPTEDGVAISHRLVADFATDLERNHRFAFQNNLNSNDLVNLESTINDMTLNIDLKYEHDSLFYGNVIGQETESGTTSMIEFRTLGHVLIVNVDFDVDFDSLGTFKDSELSMSGSFDDSTPTSVSYSISDCNVKSNIDFGALKKYLPVEEISASMICSDNDATVTVNVDAMQFKAGGACLEDSGDFDYDITMFVEIPAELLQDNNVSPSIQSKHQLHLQLSEPHSVVEYSGHSNNDITRGYYMLEHEHEEHFSFTVGVIPTLSDMADDYTFTYSNDNMSHHIVKISGGEDLYISFEMTPNSVALLTGVSGNKYGVNANWTEDDVSVTFTKNNKEMDFGSVNFKNMIAKFDRKVKLSYGSYINENTVRAFFGFDLNGVKKQLVWEMSLQANGIKVDVIVKDGRELSNLFVFEISVNEQFDLELYLECHDAIYQFFETSPDEIKDDIISYLRAWTTSQTEVVFFKNMIDIVFDIISEHKPDWNDALNYDHELWIDQFELFLQSVVDELKQMNPTVAAEKGDQFTFGDVAFAGMGEAVDLTVQEMQALGDSLKHQIMDGVTNELSNISSMKDTKFGRDMHNFLSKITMFLGERVSDYIVEVLNLSKSPIANIMHVNENKIFIRLPTPQFNLIGIIDQVFPNQDSDRFSKWVSPKYWEDAYYIAIAALRKISGPTNDGFTAELVDFKYARQWDGDWKVIDANCPITLAQSVGDASRVNITMDSENEMVITPEATTSEQILIFELDSSERNRVIGAFGVPDAEVYSDDLNNDRYESVFSECEVKSHQLDNPAASTDEFRDYFEDSQSLAKACFPVVSASPYLSMSESNICTIATAYQNRCKYEGAIINIPGHCTKVQVNSVRL